MVLRIGSGSLTPRHRNFRRRKWCKCKNSQALECPSPFLFFFADFAAAAGAFVALLLFLSFGSDLGHRLVVSVLVYGNKSKIGRGHMAAGSGNIVFHPALHADLHGSAKGAVD